MPDRILSETSAPASWDRIAKETAHRPWPLPARPWLVAQTWRDLLFAHWPVRAADLRPLVPAGLELDTWDGDAWVGLIPFHLGPIAPRGVPDGWGLAFPELNLRTCVSAGGKPGVCFFSLDAASLLAVIGGRLSYHLPYFWSRMNMNTDAGWIAFSSQRRHPGSAWAEFVGRYRPVGPVFHATTGSLEEWLTARYCLYAADYRGRIVRGEIHHRPWPLQPAEADLTINTVGASHGIALSGLPLVHFARRLDVLTWSPERLE